MDKKCLPYKYWQNLLTQNIMASASWPNCEYLYSAADKECDA